VSGFDTVAYFTQGNLVEGSKQHTSEHRGSEFRFASAANKASFDASPSRYAPQYGGYCARAVSQGYTAKADPWFCAHSEIKFRQKKGSASCPALPFFVAGVVICQHSISF
jgi:YHS domain-containing protein